MKYLLNLLFRKVLAVICLLVFCFAQSSIAQQKDSTNNKPPKKPEQINNNTTQNNTKKKPTRYALEATTEYWKDILLANPQIKKNKKLVLDIQNLAKKRMDEADDDTKIKTVEEYVAIFTIDWDAIDKQQKPKFKDKYHELSKNKTQIQEIISENRIREKLQDTALKEVESNKTKETPKDSVEKNNNKKNNNNSGDERSRGTPILLWVVLVLAVLAPAAVYFVLQKKNKQIAEQIAKSIVKKEVETIDKKYENKLKNTPVTQVSTSIDSKQIEQEILQKVKVDLDAIRSEIAAQKSHTPVSNKTYSETYYFGTSVIKEDYLDSKYEKSYDGNMCYVIHTDGKEGTIDIVHDNKSLIIKYQDKILKQGIAEKIGWKENDNNTFSRSEPGRVELQNNKWVVTKKVKVYFNE